MIRAPVFARNGHSVLTHSSPDKGMERTTAATCVTFPAARRATARIYRKTDPFEFPAGSGTQQANGSSKMPPARRQKGSIGILPTMIYGLPMWRASSPWGHVRGARLSDLSPRRGTDVGDPGRRRTFGSNLRIARRPGDRLRT